MLRSLKRSWYSVHIYIKFASKGEAVVDWKSSFDKKAKASIAI